MAEEGDPITGREEPVKGHTHERRRGSTSRLSAPLRTLEAGVDLTERRHLHGQTSALQRPLPGAVNILNANPELL